MSCIGLCYPYDRETFALGGDGALWANVAWMITATIFVLMMTPGLSFFYGGMVRKKNVISTMLQSFIVMGFVSVLWVVVGFSLTFGSDIGHVIGNPAEFFMFKNVGVSNITGNGVPTQIGMAVTTIPLVLFALFQMKFAIITPSLITGAFAERVHFTGYLLFMMLWTIMVYCPLAHCTWHPEGLFGMLHVHDYAGGIVVHAASGVAALAGAMFLGRRIDKKGESNRPANVPFVLLGAALLWLGWFGFNGGSSLAADGIAISAFLNTNTAAATAMVTWVTLDAVRGRKPSAMGAAIGAVVGLVAITPMAGWVSVGQSICIAFIITVCCNMAVSWRSYSKMLDDALDVFPTHGLGGIIGTVLTGLFAYDYFALDNPEMVSRTTFFINHLLVIIGVFIYTFIVSYALYWITDKIIPMRVSSSNEAEGLDATQHGEFYDPDGTHELPSDEEWFKGIEEN
ncbi:MAG: ammonium transporter [Bacteroides sp.]|nr:ammonium transporter [Bacteroides sp.]